MRIALAALFSLLLSACGDGSAIGGPGAVVPGAAAPVADAQAPEEVEAPWWSVLPRAGWAPFERVEVPEDQDWFEVYRMGPRTWAILEPGQWQEVICWLIEGDDKALLFDTGLGIGNVEALARALTDREIVVLNSHTHMDHVGGNHAFREILGMDHPYAAEQRAGRTHEQGMKDLFPEGAVWMDLPADFDKASFRTRGWTVTGYVRDEQIIDLGGRRLQVLFTPGHSPDSLTLLDRDGRMLFVGDTFYPAGLYAHIEGASLPDYRASAARLAGLADAVDLVATGHNEPVQGGAILNDVHAAFEAVAAGRDPDETTATTAVHDFGTFSIVTAL